MPKSNFDKLCLTLTFLAAFLCASLFFTKHSFSQNLDKKSWEKFITIKGNERIDDQTIISYLDLKGLKKNSRQAFDASIKRLHESDFFLEVKIYRENKKIIVELKENPIVSEIKFVGNKKLEDDALKSELELKKRGIFTKAKLQSDLKRINEIYLKSGRFLTKIDPKIIQRNQNRVEIIFDIFEGKKAKIKNIYFIGNNAFSDPDLLDEISTKKSQWYKFLSSSDTYDADRVEFDKEKLRRFYGSKGYADFAVISAIAQISPKKDSFFITFLLEEGIKYRMGKIEIVNYIEKFDADILQKDILIKSKKFYNSDLIEKSVDRMVETLSEKSYAFANVEPVLKRDRENQIIDIDFVIRETPRIYINQIKISGNTRTMDKVIRRELRVREGDPYNINKINRSKQRLENLGFFESVDLKTTRIAETDKVNLEIVVKEKKTGELTLGVGYSTVNKVTLNTGIKERNLGGTGQELGLNLQKSYSQFSGEVNYTRPYFTGRSIDVGFDLSKYQQNRRNTLIYDQNSDSVTFRGRYSISEFLSHQVYYRFSNQTINNIDSSASIGIQNLAGSYLSSSIGQSLLYDRRDNSLNPKSGYYISFSQEFSGLGGDIKTLKHEASAGYYIPTFSEDYILKFLGRGGMIEGLGQDVRSNYGFFLGGNNFRGFQYAGLGPRVISDGSAIGGKQYYVGTVEFMFPLGLPKDLGINGILFTDNGTLKGVDAISQQSTAVADSSSLRSSYGFSIAWASPLGPIRLDFSRVAKKESYDRTQNFRFSFGTSF